MADKPHDFIDQYQALVRDGLEAWSRQFDPQSGAAGEAGPADIMSRMFTGLGGYGDWMRSFSSGEPPAAPFAMGGMPPFGGTGPGPMPFGPGGPGLPPFMAGAPGSGPFGYGAPPGASAQPGTQDFNEWARLAHEALSMPAFGLTREQQEEQQALLRAWIDYAGHYQRYQGLLQGVQDRATAALREQAPPTDADSMRSVYDRWVNLAEESYGEAALSEEFKDVYAALVNAQMRLKRLQQKQVERLAVQAGMPTRTEVDSLGERLQAVRRELRKLQGVAAEVDALKAEVAALRGARRDGAPATRAASAKAAPAKKPAGKGGRR
ncbi:MAG: poly(R)-hydroxyalkanoic acid synthase subunit PhaE [Luteibacter sp.]